MSLQRKLVLSKAFEKSYKKFTGKNQLLKTSISKALIKLEQDAYDPTLKTHKLSENLAAYLSCSCGYDCRIIFIIEKDLANPNEENILLLDIELTKMCTKPGLPHQRPHLFALGYFHKITWLIHVKYDDR